MKTFIEIPVDHPPWTNYSINPDSIIAIHTINDENNRCTIRFIGDDFIRCSVSKEELLKILSIKNIKLNTDK